MLYDKLYHYQKDIVHREILSGRKAHALFMDMGTGKTITSLSLFEYSERHKILVVCPISKLHDWANDLEDIGVDTTILNKGTARNKKLLDKTPGIVINFESVWRLGDDLMNLIDDDWFILVDESHKLKRRTSKVAKYMLKLGKKTPYKAILTGTPQAQGYVDYYSQLTFVDILQMPYKTFEDLYCVTGVQMINGARFKQIIGYKNTDKLDNIINSNCAFYVRDNPNEPIHIDVKIPKSKKYDEFRYDRVYTLKDGDFVLGDTMGSYRMGLRQLASGFIKTEEVSKFKTQWVTDLLESTNERVVIFYNFNMELSALESVCKRAGRPISYYNGNDKDLSKFLNNDDGIALCNYKSAAESINELVASSICVFYSPTDDYILFEQAKKRVDRLGQTKTPLMYYLKATGTIEVAIYRALKSGKDFDNKLFNLYLENE